MSEDTSNPVWGPLFNARAALAASATFRTLVDAADADAALPSILIPAAPASTERPFALITHGEDRSWERSSTGLFADNGSIFLHLEADVPEEHQGETADNLYAAEQWFDVLLGNIIKEIAERSHTTGLVIRGFTYDEQPERTDIEDRESEGDYYSATLEIQWGLEGES